jgi:signal transduction histidine kinase
VVKARLIATTGRLGSAAAACGRLGSVTVAAGPLGIRTVDVALTGAVIAAVELNVVVGGGYGAQPLNAEAYLLGALLAAPILLRRRWPFQVLLACSVLMFLYYTIDRRNISPAPLLCVPLFDGAVAGYLAWAIAIPVFFMATGLVVVGASAAESFVTLANDFLPSIVILMLAVMLGEVVHSRRALAAETARRLRLAEEEREAETARRVAEERLRIARELHDTVAHSMATITVQAASALHVVDAADRKNDLRQALTAIRATSKDALTEMRGTLGQLRSDAAPDAGGKRGADAGPSAGGGADADADPGPDGSSRAGVGRLPALRAAVAAAGVTVDVQIDGEPVTLPAQVDHTAYRIIQESLTNVLKHAGPGATATVRLRYRPGTLDITVADDGAGDQAAASGEHRSTGTDATARRAAARGGGHGITGMGERAAAAGGTVTAAPRPGGGFEVTATLPLRVSVQE